MRVSRRERIGNEEVEQRMGIEGWIIDDVERKQLVCYADMCKEWMEIDSRNK
jgi:hypothetical protein